jgi:hypothetical protein
MSQDEIFQTKFKSSETPTQDLVIGTGHTYAKTREKWIWFNFTFWRHTHDTFAL